MLVEKDDCLKNLKKDKYYRVLMADEEMFLIAPCKLVSYDEKTKRYEINTSCEKLELYSNEESINSLKDLGFEKIDFKF